MGSEIKKKKTGKLTGPRLLSDAATRFHGSRKHNTPIWSGKHTSAGSDPSRNTVVIVFCFKVQDEAVPKPVDNPVSHSHSRDPKPARYRVACAPPRSTTNLASPSAKLQLLWVTHREDDVLMSPPQESSGLMEPPSEEGGSQQKGHKGNCSTALPLPTAGSKAGSCPWVGLCLWARKEQAFRHATHLATPTCYFHASPYPAWIFCWCPSKAPQPPSALCRACRRPPERNWIAARR